MYIFNCHLKLNILYSYLLRNSLPTFFSRSTSAYSHKTSPNVKRLNSESSCANTKDKIPKVTALTKGYGSVIDITVQISSRSKWRGWDWRNTSLEAQQPRQVSIQPTVLAVTMEAYNIYIVQPSCIRVHKHLLKLSVYYSSGVRPVLLFCKQNSYCFKLIEHTNNSVTNWGTPLLKQAHIITSLYLLF